MSKGAKKAVFLAVKICIAAGLLAWILTKVHWHDYVQDRQGKEYSVLRADPAERVPRMLQVATGTLWWEHRRDMPAGAFQPVGDTGNPIRMGFASTMAGSGRASWPCPCWAFCFRL